MCSETSTDQHIIYNIKQGCLELASSWMSPHQISHHQCADPGIDSMGSPHPRTQVHRTHAKDSHPKPASERTPDPSGTRISSPRTIARVEQPWCAQRNPVVCPRNGPGLSAHRPQSGGCPVHLLLLPSTGVKKPALKHFPKSRGIFYSE